MTESARRLGRGDSKLRRDAPLESDLSVGCWSRDKLAKMDANFCEAVIKALDQEAEEQRKARANGKPAERRPRR